MIRQRSKGGGGKSGRPGNKDAPGKRHSIGREQCGGGLVQGPRCLLPTGLLCCRVTLRDRWKQKQAVQPHSEEQEAHSQIPQTLPRP